MWYLPSKNHIYGMKCDISQGKIAPVVLSVLKDHLKRSYENQCLPHWAEQVLSRRLSSDHLYWQQAFLIHVIPGTRIFVVFRLIYNSWNHRVQLNVVQFLPRHSLYLSLLTFKSSCVRLKRTGIYITLSLMEYKSQNWLYSCNWNGQLDICCGQF